MRILVGIYLIINCENGKIYIGSSEAKAKRSSLLKGNQKRRDNLKWPHALGVKCFCLECIERKRNYQKERQKLMKEGKWNFRNGAQIKNEMNI